jgi:hypothetical protein
MQAIRVLDWLARLPGFLIWVAAVVFAALRWKRHPAVSGLVVGAAACNLMASLGSRMLPRWGVMALRGVRVGEFRLALRWVLAAGLELLRAGGLGLLFVAVFGWRKS